MTYPDAAARSATLAAGISIAVRLAVGRAFEDCEYEPPVVEVSEGWCR
jgi:hypothetical protein